VRGGRTPEQRLPRSFSVKLRQGVLTKPGQMRLELKRFNDSALNRDLEMLCTKVAQEQPCLPDGRRLLFRVQGAEILRLDAQEQAVACNPGYYLLSFVRDVQRFATSVRSHWGTPKLCALGA
jgi:hypothetical protein